MIVFTSDHGDYLGDHWMGEKDLFHDQSAKIPLIVIDPSDAADRTRGTVCDALVEAIDLAPTFIEYFGGKPPDHILEGRSLMPLLHGERAGRLAQGGVLRIRLFDAGCAAEAQPADRAMPPVHGVRRTLEIHSRLRLPADAVRPCRAIRRNSPTAAKIRSCADVIARLQSALFDWALHPKDHITTSNEKIAAYADKQLQVKGGILIGIWDEAELAAIRDRIDSARSRAPSPRSREVSQFSIL